jgi:hypothetical protein
MLNEVDDIYIFIGFGVFYVHNFQVIDLWVLTACKSLAWHRRSRPFQHLDFLNVTFFKFLLAWILPVPGFDWPGTMQPIFYSTHPFS